MEGRRKNMRGSKGMIVLAIIMVLGGAVNAFMEGDDLGESILLTSVYLMIVVFILAAAYIVA